MPLLPTSEGGCRADNRNLIKEYSDKWQYVGDKVLFDQLQGGKTYRCHYWDC